RVHRRFMARRQVNFGDGRIIVLHRHFYMESVLGHLNSLPLRIVRLTHDYEPARACLTDTRPPSDGLEPEAMLFCEACAAPVPEGAAFCPNCGTRLRAAERPAASAIMRSERKLITVLFADIKGSIDLVARHDPELAGEVLDAVVNEMSAAVRQFGG